MPSKLCRWGNSLGIRLPQYIAERTGLVAGDYLYIQLNDAGEIVIRPVKAIEVAAGYAAPATQAPQKKVSVQEQW